MKYTFKIKTLKRISSGFQYAIKLFLYLFIYFVKGEYLQNRCDAADTACTPCEDRMPSCVGLPDGDNMYPGKPMSELYVNCSMDRTISMKKCQRGLFDQSTKQCVEDVTDSTYYSNKYSEIPTTRISPFPTQLSELIIFQIHVIICSLTYVQIIESCSNLTGV